MTLNTCYLYNTLKLTSTFRILYFFCHDFGKVFCIPPFPYLEGHQSFYLFFCHVMKDLFTLVVDFPCIGWLAELMIGNFFRDQGLGIFLMINLKRKVQSLSLSLSLWVNVCVSHSSSICAARTTHVSNFEHLHSAFHANLHGGVHLLLMSHISIFCILPGFVLVLVACVSVLYSSQKSYSGGSNNFICLKVNNCDLELFLKYFN